MATIGEVAQKLLTFPQEIPILISSDDLNYAIKDMDNWEIEENVKQFDGISEEDEPIFHTLDEALVI